MAASRRFLSSLRGGRRPRSRIRLRFAPRVDSLETRALLSTIVVTSHSDSGPGSLRQAIADSASGGTISFADSLRGQTITLAASSGPLSIGKDLTIDGPGAGQLAVSGGGATEDIRVASGASVTISGLTITGGSAGQGGGIAASEGSLTLTDDTASGDAALGGAGTLGGAGGIGEGGAIFSAAGLIATYDPSTGTISTTLFPSNLTILDMSFLGNRATGGSSSGGAGGDGEGGALFNNAGSTASVSESLFSFNAATGGAGDSGGNGEGGAIFHAGPPSYAPTQPGGTLNLSDSLVVANVAQGGAAANGGTATAGQGVGGGLYLALGSTTTLKRTVVAFNRASTSNNDIYGTYE